MVGERIANPLVSRVLSAVAAMVFGSHRKGRSPDPKRTAAEAELLVSSSPRTARAVQSRRVSGVRLCCQENSEKGPRAQGVG